MRLYFKRLVLKGADLKKILFVLIILFIGFVFLAGCVQNTCKENTCFMCEGTKECVDLDEWKAAGKDTSDCAMVKWDENFEHQYSCYCKENKCVQEITPVK